MKTLRYYQNHRRRRMRGNNQSRGKRRITRRKRRITRRKSQRRRRRKIGGVGEGVGEEAREDEGVETSGEGVEEDEADENNKNKIYFFGNFNEDHMYLFFINDDDNYFYKQHGTKMQEFVFHIMNSAEYLYFNKDLSINGKSFVLSEDFTTDDNNLESLQKYMFEHKDFSIENTKDLLREISIDFVTSEAIDLNKAKDKLSEISVKFNKKCPNMTLEIDYIYYMRPIRILKDFGDPCSLILYIYDEKSEKSISSIAIKIKRMEQNKCIYFDFDDVLGDQHIELLQSVAVLIANIINKDAFYIVYYIEDQHNSIDLQDSDTLEIFKNKCQSEIDNIET